ncbi:alpha-N-acetylglucosaminidase [Streptomyces sp. NBC_01498]|uniref:alpha-N-acetylglucosaminidase n=1 Tax=Streptomyces sp. NBC_01498 TaxID=2975870 RepID=UPI002E7B4372|nr:alpha-N-acetylglucosaminidase [Streptomyces sp. NBC_01498]WTL27209.1 alpha-N-acetylglucosaminidase [Streptomyces sp. NBC_01498]
MNELPPPPSSPSRRAVLAGAGAVGIGTALTARSSAAALPPAASASRRAADPAASVAAARAAVGRLLPAHADQFHFQVPDGGGPERFRVTGSAGRIEVSGTDAGVLLTGVHWYLKYTCGAHLTWSGSRTDLPATLPAPRRPLERSATVRHRFALNDTHDGYTAPYADWPRWERLLDILALHGCNEILVTTGHEAVYHRLLTGFGYTDAEARAWLPTPSHQPWWLLQNMSAYGGPLSPELIGRRARLGRRITDRARELGMSPVLPGYFGTVPDGFAARNPGARTVPQGSWNGLPRPDWLDPRTPVFAEVAAAYYRHQGELLGPVDHVKMDLLHEGGIAGDVPVADAARAVETALRTARPDATWVILGWRNNPVPALLDALDTDRVLIVDGLSDLDSVTDRERDWGGTPYAFGTIPNFGGRTTLGANTDRWTERFTAWRDKPGSALVGTAYMPEAAERDPAAFELFSELAWRREPVDRASWFRSYADLRYGGEDTAARDAFGFLAATAYRLTTADGRPVDSLFAHRPSLTAPVETGYDTAEFDKAFDSLLEVAEGLRGSDAYRHDVTELARQALANRSRLLLPQLRGAYQGGDTETFRALAALWLRLLRLSDTMAGCHRAFLLGPWLEDAKRLATGPEEAVTLERTARALITTWADRSAADVLSNYANRDWHGLLSDVHLPQWQTYLDGLADALADGRAPEPLDERDWYPDEEAWTRARDAYPVRATGDAHRTALRVRDALAGAPYQGTVTVTADPPALAPGATGTLRADFRNTNGLRGTGPVDLTLTGPDARPDGPARLPAVEPAGTGSASWSVTAPGEPLTAPLRPQPYALALTYGPSGEERVLTVRRGTLYVAGPPAARWRTYTSNGAVFGQLGDRFAINGGGRDLWRATAQFGTAYEGGALGDGASATVRVTAQEDTGAWARAGVVARNGLATPGSPGFVNLAVTPSSGVVLSYDATGDGTLDTYRRVTGVTAPVLLRLARSGTKFTGSFSTDDGATWRTVATVTVPGAAGAQDVGLFMSASNGGSELRGTVEFDGWAVSAGGRNGK